MDEERLHDLIRGGESLTVEFKSDRQTIGDAAIYEEVVALANTQAELCQVSEHRASRLLRNLRDEGTLEQEGKGRGAFYRVKTRGETRGPEAKSRDA